jgi:hypothetical protein
MLFEAAVTRVGLRGQRMLMGQAKILTADPGLEGGLRLPRGEDDRGRRRLGGAEHVQTPQARRLLDLPRPGAKPLLAWLTSGRGDGNTIGHNGHTFLLVRAHGRWRDGRPCSCASSGPGRRPGCLGWCAWTPATTSTLSPPSRVPGLRASTRRHHSIGDGEHGGRSPGSGDVSAVECDGVGRRVTR